MRCDVVPWGSMKLLHTIRSLDPRDGGVVALTRDLVRAGVRHGDRAEIYTLDEPGSAWLKSWESPVHALGPGKGTYGCTPHLIPWLREHATDYDGVVMHGLWQYTSWGAWRGLCAAKRRPPHVVFAHGMLDGWFRQNEKLRHLKKMIYWPLEHQVIRGAAAVCFTAEEEFKNSVGTFQPYDGHSVLVGAGIEPPPVQKKGNDAASFLERFPVLKGKRLILFLGRLHLKKGCDLLARAFATLAKSSSPDLVLVYAGPDPGGMEETLRGWVPESLQSRVVFTGMLEGDEKWAALRAADCLIIPSHQENFCLAAAEALACGVPVLASDRVNIWREIVESGAGFVQPDTEEGTLALLQQWESTLPTERKAMRVRAKDCFAKHFSIDVVYEKLAAIFHKGIESP